MLANSAIDAVVRGDGEEAALEIVEGRRVLQAFLA